MGIGRIALAVSLSLAMANPAFADEPVFSGGTFVPFEDGTPKDCIDVSSNTVSLMVTGIQIQRSEGWFRDLFTTKSSLGAKFNLVLTSGESEKFEFPKVVRLRAQKDGGDLAVLPVKNVHIVSKHDMVNNNKAYTSLALAMSFVSVAEKSTELRALNTLISFTEQLPLPPNPYVTGAGYFGQFANTVFDELVKGDSNDDPDALFGATIADSPTAASANTCPSDGLREGPQAVVFDYQGKPPSGTNIVRVEDASAQCYWFDPQSSRIFFEARTTACAKTRPATAKVLHNPAISLLVNKWPKAKGSSGSGVNQLSSIEALTAGAGALSRQRAAQFLKSDPALSIAQLDPAMVATLAKTPSRWQAADGGSTKGMISSEGPNNLEAAAAIAFRRCTLMGIAPESCQ